ncbi:MAG: hypothetical protein QNJ64_06885 [Crocosphaera sp.]|nr:hypothetical protein [Crocosphaera sp.]
MPTKKKLSTRPIKIEVPPVENTTNLDSTWPDSITESSKIEKGKLESLKQENSLPDSSNLESNETSVTESKTQENIKPESGLSETILPETNLTDSNHLDSKIDNNPENIKPLTRKPDSITDYKKVSMRVSQESYERLREFRGDTGIPYEILVDVMVRNWDSLPKRTQNAYLKESQQVRAQRLIAGQQKAMLTTQQKYSQL